MPVLALAAFALLAGTSDPVDNDLTAPLAPSLPRAEEKLPPNPVQQVAATTTTHAGYDGALSCGIGASAGLAAGLIGTSYGAGSITSLALIAILTLAANNAAGGVLAVALIVGVYVIDAAGGVIGAAIGAALLGDQEYATASAIAGALGGAAGLVVGGGGLVASELWLGGQNPNAANGVGFLGLYLVAVAGSALAGVSVAGLTAGALAPVFAQDP